MIKNFIGGVILSSLVVFSPAISGNYNYKVANGTGGILTLSPKMCYGYYTTPEPFNAYDITCDPTQTGVTVPTIKTADAQISIEVPDKPTKAADPSLGNYGWAGLTDRTGMIFPGSTSLADVNGTIAMPSSDWGDDYDNCPAKLLNISGSNMVMVFHAYGTWLTYEYESTFKKK